jgi:hypothetical protein
MYRDFRAEDMARFDPYYQSGLDAQGALNYELFGGPAPTFGGVYGDSGVTGGTQYQGFQGTRQPPGNFAAPTFNAPNRLAPREFNAPTRPDAREFDPRANFEESPGYQFRLREGLEAAQGSAAARHGLASGASMDALNRTAQNYASNEWDNHYNRSWNEYAYGDQRDRSNFTQDYGNAWNQYAYGDQRDLGVYSEDYGNAWNQYATNYGNDWQRYVYGDSLATNERENYLNRLTGMAGSGQNAAGAMGSSSQYYGGLTGQSTLAGANAVSQGISGAANATAAGRIGATNAIGAGISDGIGAWQYGNMLDAFKPQG